MTVVILVPILVMMLGAVAYAIATNGKVSEMGRLAFAVGLFWTVWAVHGSLVGVIR